MDINCFDQVVYPSFNCSWFPGARAPSDVYPSSPPYRDSVKRSHIPIGISQLMTWLGGTVGHFPPYGHHLSSTSPLVTPWTWGAGVLVKPILPVLV